MNSLHDSETICIPGAVAAALVESLIQDNVAVRIRVHGHSMRPTICSGDAVVLGPIRDPVHFGDILLCRRADGSNACYIHRAVWPCRDGRWRTKGDALKSLDPPIPVENLIGRVEIIERSGDKARVEYMAGLKAQWKARLRASLSLAQAVLGKATRL